MPGFEKGLAMISILIILILSLSQTVSASETINTLIKPGRYDGFDLLPVKVAISKFNWLIIAFILVLGLGGYGLAYACPEHERKLIVENEKAFCAVLIQVAVDKAKHDTAQKFVFRLRESIKRAEENNGYIELGPE